jgi:hypothetical protein
MVTLRMRRQEAEDIIDLLEISDPYTRLDRWILAAEIREAIAVLPYQRENVDEAEKSNRLLRLQKAYALAGLPVPDWVTPGEQREAERASETNPT